jgi:hypothetical protein
LLTDLDLRASTGLVYLDCSGNQLTSLKLSRCSELWCYSNKLPLSELYAASKIVNAPTNRMFGAQYLDMDTLKTGESIDLSAQAVFDDTTYTDFVVKKHYNPAVLGTDYTINNGVITFLSNGEYEVTMKNDAIITHQNYPASVTAAYYVVSTDATLSSLYLTGVDFYYGYTYECELNPTFSSDITNYTVNVPFEVQEVYIGASRNAYYATVTGDVSSDWYDRKQLQVGQTVFHIIVTAEDGETTRTYTVTVHREKDNSITETETAMEKIKAYPNPAQTQFTVTNTEDADIYLFNILGQKVLQTHGTEKNTVINTAPFPQGVYVLKVVKDNVSTVHKVVVEM